MAGELLPAGQQVDTDDHAQDDVFRHSQHGAHGGDHPAHHALHGGQEIGGGPVFDPVLHVGEGVVYVVLQNLIALQVVQHPFGELIHFGRDGDGQGHDALPHLREHHAQQQVEDHRADQHHRHHAEEVGPPLVLLRQGGLKLPLQKAAGGFQQVGHGAAVDEGGEYVHDPVEAQANLVQLLDGEEQEDGQGQGQEGRQGLEEDLL